MKNNMEKKITTLENIDQYMIQFPVEVQKKMQQLRKTIQKAAPKAREKISYAMPTFFQEGNLVHFAAYAGHIGFYPAPSGIAAFKEELSVYKWAKGSVQFPLDKPLPLTLIAKIVKFRVKENEEITLKKSLRKCKKGHSYYKTSDCPTCPECEKKRIPDEKAFSLLSAPARRALESQEIFTTEKLAEFSEKEILSLHGMGPKSLPILKKILNQKKLKFKK